jgi:hypothetical protein
MTEFHQMNNLSRINIESTIISHTIRGSRQNKNNQESNKKDFSMKNSPFSVVFFNICALSHRTNRCNSARGAIFGFFSNRDNLFGIDFIVIVFSFFAVGDFFRVGFTFVVDSFLMVVLLGAPADLVIVDFAFVGCCFLLIVAGFSCLVVGVFFGIGFLAGATFLSIGFPGLFKTGWGCFLMVTDLVLLFGVCIVFFIGWYEMMCFYLLSCKSR